MAVDKLVDSTQLDSDLTSVANAIRTKGGTSASLAFPAGFVSAVEAIPTGGGGYTAKDFLMKDAPVGDVTIVVDGNIPAYSALSGRTSDLTHLTIDMRGYGFDTRNGNGTQFRDNFIPKYTFIGNNSTTVPPYVLTANGSATDQFTLTMKGSFGSIQPNGLRANQGLKTFDYSYGGDGTTGIYATVFYDCNVLTTIIIRGTSLMPLHNTNAFTSSNTWKNGGTGGTLYVPNALLASYQSASNWSTILGYTNNQIKSIESTHNDPTAPFDMTLYYADGTSIS